MTKTAVAVVGLVGVAAAQSTAPAGAGQAGLVPTAKRVIFSDATQASGLGGMYVEGNSHTGGSAWVDYNGDFWPDLFVTNGAGNAHYLYRNDGDGTFTDVSHLIPKPDPMLEGAGVKFADIDNDGDSDILVFVDSPVLVNPAAYNPPEGGPNLLYVNQGDGTFVESAAAAGLVDPRGWRNIAAGFADYDRDGFIDVYLANWQMNENPPGEMQNFQNFDRLLKNDGDGTFTEVTPIVGTDGMGRDCLTLLWFDSDLDGWQDLYVTNVSMFHNPPFENANDVFYRNQAGAGFADVTGPPATIGNDAWAGMGMDVGDIDNDGDWDMYITDVYGLGGQPLGNVLYLGDGNGSFGESVHVMAGVESDTSWPCNFADFDLDGWVDLWVGTAFDTAPDDLFLNRGDGTFDEIGSLALVGNESRGGSIADYDGDGDIDFVVTQQRGNTKLIRNDSLVANQHWIEFKLIGVTSNRDAIGALVRVTSGGITQMRRVSGGDSAHSQMDLIVHFGLDDATECDVQVDWPNGAQLALQGVRADQLVFLQETVGLLPEQLVSGSAIYSQAGGQLAVSMQTTYGGRTKLAAIGFGQLTYSAESLVHARVFATPQNPGTVQVRSSYGNSWTLPVTVIP